MTKVVIGTAAALGLGLASLACEGTLSPPGRPTALSPGTPAIDAASARQGGSSMSEAPVVRFSDGAQVGTSRLVRTPNGVNFTLSTSDLTPGHAYTLWIMTFNLPGSCAVANQCAEADIGNPAAKPDMMYAAGSLVGGSGRATFAGRLTVGDVAGSINAPVGMPSYGLLDPYGAEVWLAVHDHGKKLPEFMPDMTQSVAGGCVNAGIGAPPWDLYEGPEFGRRGPNTCMTIQAAFHQP